MSDSPIESTKAEHHENCDAVLSVSDILAGITEKPCNCQRVGLPRGDDQKLKDQQRLSNVVYVLLGTRDPEKVRNWINAVGRIREELDEAYHTINGLEQDIERYESGEV